MVVSIFPGLKEKFNEQGFSTKQYNFYLVEHLTLTILYSALFILVLLNVLLIFFKQKKWSNLPLLFFYVMSVIAITVRLMCCIILFKWETWIFIVYSLQPAAKICLGLA